MLLAVLCAAFAVVTASPSSTTTHVLDYREHPTTNGPNIVTVPIVVFRTNNTEGGSPVVARNNGTGFLDVDGVPSGTSAPARADSRLNTTKEINNVTVQHIVNILVPMNVTNYQNHRTNSSEGIENIAPMKDILTPEDVRQILIDKDNATDDIRKTLLVPKFGFLKLNETGMRPEHHNFRQNLSETLTNLVPALINKTDSIFKNMSDVLSASMAKPETERNRDILKLKEAIRGVPSEVLARLSSSNLRKKIDHILKSEPNTSDGTRKDVPLSKIEHALDYSTYREAISGIPGSRSSSIDSVNGYNTYMDGDRSHVNEAPPDVQMVEESPAYASSVVLASDILSLSSAVAEVKDNMCREQGYRFLDGLLTNKRWALKMFDASAKSPQGLLFGSSYHLGNFDECVAIEEEGSTTYRPLVGKYCLATIEWPQSEAVRKQRSGRSGELRWAVCVPDACDAAAVRQFVLDVLFRTVGNTTRVLVDDKDCYTRQPILVDSLDDAFLGLIVFFAVLIITCTVLDLWWGRKVNKRRSLMQEVAVSFSATNNVRKLLSTKQPNGFGLDCIAGIKTLAMVFIVAGHACLFIASGPVMDAEAWDRLLQQPLNSFMLNNTLLVDTFLMLSAFLFCRLLLLELDKRRGRLNIIPIYIFRYIRVTPAYLVVILFYMTWLPKSGEGPLWKDKLQLEQERCTANWWANILYVNNYVNTESLCMFQSWYLSVDTQLFFLAPAFIYPLWRWQRVGPAVLAVATAVSAIIPGVITYEDQLDPTLMVYAKEFKDISQNTFFKEAYIKTHMKMTPYFMGLWFGYILHRVQSNNYKFSTAFKAAAWVASIILGTSVVFSISLFYQEWYSYSLLDSISYAALHKLAWGLANGWLIIACATGNGGFLGKLLTWKFLVPISRLTFCAYLVNGIVELYFIGTLRHPLHISFFNVFGIAVAHILLTFILAMVLCLVFESPIHGIEKILLRTVGRPSDNTEKDLSAEENSSTRSTCTSQPKLDT